MKKLFTLIMTSVVIFGCTETTSDTSVEEKTITKIAFGSCSAQYLSDMRIYQRITELNPDLYIAGGDNVYADFFALAPGTKEYIEGAYRQLGGRGYFANFRATIPEILPIWDDHDTGENDGVVNNPVKGIAKQAFFDFWKIPADAPRRNRPDGAIYDVKYYGDDAHRVQIILLDLRWNHSPYKTSGPGAALEGYDTIMNPNATILGATQWSWLEAELRKPAKVRIIMSSLQFNSNYGGGENWAVLPLEKQKMIDLIKTTQANGVFFISGDVHFAELTKTQPSGLYPLYDLTASGITHHEARVSPLNDNIRVGNGWQYVNFGFINIDWNTTPVSIKLQIFGNTQGSGTNGTLTTADAKVTHTITLDELKF